MTERACPPTAAEYLHLAERSEQTARIAAEDHGTSDPLAVSERQMAAYYRRRHEQSLRAVEIAQARTRLRFG